MNTNCLEGIECPYCGSEEPFDIIGTARFRVYDQGSDIFWELEWEDNAFCECIECGYMASIAKFREKSKSNTHG